MNDHQQIAYVVGVISDTHIPDRVSNLHPDVFRVFRDAGVQEILHAGDICLMDVINELEQIAPVTAVWGNRDFFLKRFLKREILLEISGVKVVLMHGHGSWMHYILDKFLAKLHGYVLERYIPLLTGYDNKAKVVVFGHTHMPENIRRNGCLLFNPGSAGKGWKGKLSLPPTVGLLRFMKDGTVEGEIIPLTGAVCKKRTWIIEQNHEI